MVVDEEGFVLAESVAEFCPATSGRPRLRKLTEILPAHGALTGHVSIAVPNASGTPSRCPPEADPGAAAHVQRVMRAAVEILGGRRPARQLAAVLRPDLLHYLVKLGVVAEPLQPRVRRVLTWHQPIGTRDILEAVAVIDLSTGIRALAARFERYSGDPGVPWRCTALDLRLTAGDLKARRAR